MGIDADVLVRFENFQVPLTTLPGSTLTFCVRVELGSDFQWSLISMDFFSSFEICKANNTDNS